MNNQNGNNTTNNLQGQDFLGQAQELYNQKQSLQQNIQNIDTQIQQLNQMQTAQVMGQQSQQRSQGNRVVAVRKDDRGDLTAFKLDDGRELTFDQCVEAIHNGEIPNLIAALGRPTNYGDQPLVIRSQPDGDPTNNLDNLPLF